MTMDTRCTLQIDCTICPKTSERALVYSRFPMGQHFSAEKCTQNCIIFMLKGELLVNSKEHPGTMLQSDRLILQAIGSKMELLAITDVEYIIYWFTGLSVLCEERYEEILNYPEAPLTYSPLKVIPRLKYLLKDLAEYLKEEPMVCSKYIDIKCQELVYILTCYYPLPQISTFFHPINIYAEGILHDLQYTKQRISVISAHYGFDSPSHFAHFCKDSFGDTPRSLRKRAASGERIAVICKEGAKRRIAIQNSPIYDGCMSYPAERIYRCRAIDIMGATAARSYYGIISLIVCLINGFLLFLRNI